MGLAALFLPHLPAGAHRPEPQALEDPLRALLARARQDWPDLPVTDDRFLRHVAERVPPEAELPGSLAALHAGDLYLACACAHGDPRAIAGFEAGFMGEVPAYLGRQESSRAFIDEVQQALRARVLVADGGGPPRIAGYLGRGPLGGWLRMAALRVAVNLRAADPARREVSVDGAATPRAAVHDPELALLRSRHGTQFREALQSTLTALPTREANVLRLHFLEGLTLEAIGALYQVNERTVRRWIAGTRQTILQETRRRLVESAQLTSSQLTGLIDLLRGEIDVTLVRLLRPPEK